MSANPSTLPDDLRDALGAAPEAEDLARVWHLLDAPADDAATDVAWSALRSRITAPEASGVRSAPDRPAPDRPAHRPAARGLWRRARWAVAAGVLALTAAGVWWTLPVTHRAPLGEQLAVVLPDGSEVTLASGAELSHNRRFETRDVALVGEAFFDVQTQEDPFIVTTHDARIEVLGTAFNVRAWEATAVALVHGSVRVSARTQDVILAPGESVTTSGDLTPQEADVDRAGLWRTGGLSFDDEPLGAVLRDVARRYDVQIEPGSAPLGERVSAVYAVRPDLDALLGDLGAATGTRFARTARGYRAAGTGD